jgi:hypothetical protein
MTWKYVPETYQPDSGDTRKDNPQIKYVKMYHEDFVKELIQQVKDLSECLHGAINDSKNRGTQRASIPMIQKGYKTVEDFKK